MTTAYTELSREDIPETVRMIENYSSDYTLDQDKTKILKQDLKFAPAWQRYICEDYSSLPYKRVDFLRSGTKLLPLKYTPDPYHDNGLSKIELVLTEQTVSDYLSFYFDYYRATSGGLKPINHTDDIEWQEDLPPMTRQSLEKDLKNYPIIKKNNDGFSILQTCIFRMAIMEVSFHIRADGQIDIQDHKVLIDDLPVKTFP